MTKEQAVPDDSKLRLANHAEYFRCLQPFHEPIECEGVADLSDESQQVLQQVLQSARVAVAEAVVVGSDEDPPKSVPSCLIHEEIQSVEQVWQEVRELEVAVQAQEALLLSARADVMSAVGKGIHTIEQSGSLRVETARLPLEDAQKGPRELSAAKHQLQAQMLQKQSAVQDELARARMYVRVAHSKAGDLANRRKSLLPAHFGATSPEDAVAGE
jgi:hypothetical protein